MNSHHKRYIYIDMVTGEIKNQSGPIDDPTHKYQYISGKASKRNKEFRPQLSSDGCSWIIFSYRNGDLPPLAIVKKMTKHQRKLREQYVKEQRAKEVADKIKGNDKFWTYIGGADPYRDDQVIAAGYAMIAKGLFSKKLDELDADGFFENLFKK
jgi:hypothetical protein